MGLQSSDLILVERGNTLYKETYGNRANIESSDLLLVERNNTLYKCTYADWANANNTDLILVERSNTLYKETKSNWPTTSYTDIHSANYAVPSSKITFTYGNGSNQTTNFSVFEVQVEVSSTANSSTGYLYIGVRNTASTSYYGDLPIGAVQILQSNGTSFRSNTYVECDWNFALGNTVDGYNEWGTTDSSEAGSSVITNVSTNPATFDFYTIGTTATNGKRRFSYTTNGTSSSNVGAAKGVSTSSYPGGMTSILPVGTENIAQDASGGYIFNECSSSDTGDVVWLSAPTATNGSAVMELYNGDRIRICYYGGGNGQTSTNGLQPSDCIYLRWDEE
jgi:hypothetical protein